MTRLFRSLPRHGPSLHNHLFEVRPVSRAFFRTTSSSSSSHPPFPTVPTCPDPTCACAPTPPMPEGLPIDHSRPLSATMAPYTQHVVIATGQDDWTSRIEEDGVGENWGNLVRHLKDMFRQGGKYADPYNNLLITNSSFQASLHHAPSVYASAFLFPAFKYVPRIPISSTSLSGTTDSDRPNLDSFARAFLLPRKLHFAHAGIPDAQKLLMTSSPEYVSQYFADALDIKQSPTILICGHGGRDMRCGIIGPVLRAEFERVLHRNGFTVNNGTENTIDGPKHANIAYISHIGGHKYAGNVIIYIPPALMTTESSSSSSTVVSSLSSLAGKGIWYGRVEPKHVEGLVEETIFKGRVVEEHFRGGVGMNGEVYR